MRESWIGKATCAVNASESFNAVLKQKVNYKRNKLPVFLEKIKELIREQDSEIEKAVIDRGKYMINPEFKKFLKTGGMVY